MASKDSRPGDRHRYPPIAYRPPVDAREWLAEQSKATGLAVSALITQAIRAARDRPGSSEPQAERAEA